MWNRNNRTRPFRLPRIASVHEGDQADISLVARPVSFHRLRARYALGASDPWCLGTYDGGREKT
jgi:hypothetical protein